MPKLEDIRFVNKKMLLLYLAIEKYSLNQSSLLIGMTYSNAHKALKVWVEKELIYATKSGRRYNIIYTPKGKRLAVAFKELKIILTEEGVQF